MIDMEILKRNKGVIVFYLLLTLGTLVITYNNEKELDIGTENRYVYLER